MEVKLILGDCLEVMKSIPDKSVDAIITDLPYGTTAYKWDVIIPFEPMWEQVKRINKGVFVTTASQPFTSKLVMSNLDWFRYCLIWNKNNPTGFLDAQRRPMNDYEEICIFSRNGTTTYNPQGMKPQTKPQTEVYGKFGHSYMTTGTNYPRHIIAFNKEINTSHPTQKPVNLYKYLILTFTYECDTVLDITMGSGTTGVACVQAGRNFIGIELDPTYFAIAEKRIAEAQLQDRLF